MDWGHLGYPTPRPWRKCVRGRERQVEQHNALTLSRIASADGCLVWTL